MYGCVFHKEDGFCEKFSDDRCKSYCVMGPCQYAIPSNADKIRQMSDEELAFYIVNHPMWTDTDACIDWLKAPVEMQDG